MAEQSLERKTQQEPCPRVLARLRQEAAEGFQEQGQQRDRIGVGDGAAQRRPIAVNQPRRQAPWLVAEETPAKEVLGEIAIGKPGHEAWVNPPRAQHGHEQQHPGHNAQHERVEHGAPHCAGAGQPEAQQVRQHPWKQQREQPSVAPIVLVDDCAANADFVQAAAELVVFVDADDDSFGHPVDLRSQAQRLPMGIGGKAVCGDLVLVSGGVDQQQLEGQRRPVARSPIRRVEKLHLLDLVKALEIEADRSGRRGGEEPVVGRLGITRAVVHDVLGAEAALFGLELAGGGDGLDRHPVGCKGPSRAGCRRDREEPRQQEHPPPRRHPQIIRFRPRATVHASCSHWPTPADSQASLRGPIREETRERHLSRNRGAGKAEFASQERLSATGSRVPSGCARVPGQPTQRALKDRPPVAPGGMRILGLLTQPARLPAVHSPARRDLRQPDIDRDRASLYTPPPEEGLSWPRKGFRHGPLRVCT